MRNENKISIERNNCDHGLWDVNGEQVPLDQMVEHYISETEGTPISLGDLKSFDYQFTYADPKDKGLHNVPGKVEIRYEK